MFDMSDWDKEGRPRKPAIVGIGAQKAGTTWLSQMLGQHPRVWAPPFKELQFFNARFIPEHQKWLPWHFRRGKMNIAKRFDAQGQAMPAMLQAYLDRLTRDPMFTNHWYKVAFSPAPEGKLPLDVTPEYSTLPPEGVEFVARFLPRAKFIYLVRHPVDRAVSQLKMNLDRARRRPASEQEWMAEIADPVLMDRGDYMTYMPRWNQHFGPDQLLYLPFGMIQSDPLGLMRQIETFLDLEPHEYANLGRRVFPGPKGLTVPDPIRASLREKLDPQFQWLQDHFPAAFNDLLR